MELKGTVSVFFLVTTMPMSDNYNLYLINYIEQGRIQDVSQGGGEFCGTKNQKIGTKKDAWR